MLPKSPYYPNHRGSFKKSHKACLISISRTQEAEKEEEKEEEETRMSHMWENLRDCYTRWKVGYVSGPQMPHYSGKQENKKKNTFSVLELECVDVCIRVCIFKIISRSE